MSFAPSGGSRPCRFRARPSQVRTQHALDAHGQRGLPVVERSTVARASSTASPWPCIKIISRASPARDQSSPAWRRMGLTPHPTRPRQVRAAQSARTEARLPLRPITLCGRTSASARARSCRDATREANSLFVGVAREDRAVRLSISVDNVGADAPRGHAENELGVARHAQTPALSVRSAV